MLNVAFPPYIQIHIYMQKNNIFLEFITETANCTLKNLNNI